LFIKYNKISGAAMAELVKRIVNANSLTGLDDATVAYPNHLHSV